MKELIRESDTFKLNILKQHLEAHDVHAVIMDEHIGGLYHGIGTMGARLMVLDEDFEAAREVLEKME